MLAMLAVLAMLAAGGSALVCAGAGCSAPASPVVRGPLTGSLHSPHRPPLLPRSLVPVMLWERRPHPSLVPVNPDGAPGRGTGRAWGEVGQREQQRSDGAEAAGAAGKDVSAAGHSALACGAVTRHLCRSLLAVLVCAQRWGALQPSQRGTRGRPLASRQLTSVSAFN